MRRLRKRCRSSRRRGLSSASRPANSRQRESASKRLGEPRRDSLGASRAAQCSAGSGGCSLKSAEAQMTCPSNDWRRSSPPVRGRDDWTTGYSDRGARAPAKPTRTHPDRSTTPHSLRPQTSMAVPRVMACRVRRSWPDNSADLVVLLAEVLLGALPPVAWPCQRRLVMRKNAQASSKCSSAMHQYGWPSVAPHTGICEASASAQVRHHA